MPATVHEYFVLPDITIDELWKTRTGQSRTPIPKRVAVVVADGAVDVSIRGQGGVAGDGKVKERITTTGDC